MKIIRSTKCSTKFATAKKRTELVALLNEYGKVVNLFIDYFWGKGKELDNGKLLKPIVDKFKDKTWLSARLRKSRRQRSYCYGLRLGRTLERFS